MDIMAISQEFTESRYKVGFLLDGALPAEVANEIEMDGFRVRQVDDNILVVTADEGGEMVDEIALQSLREAIQQAMDVVARNDAERQRMLNGISNRIGLPVV